MSSKLFLRGPAVSCTALLFFLAGVHPWVSGAQDGTNTGRAGNREFVLPESAPRSAAAEKSPLRKWSRVARRAPGKGTHPIRLPAYAWIRVFQEFVSPVDGHSCSYYPTCSAYGIQAIDRHGLLLGIPMTAARIMRNHRPENPARYPLCEQGGRFYYWDPVESNDDGRPCGP